MHQTAGPPVAYIAGKAMHTHTLSDSFSCFIRTCLSFVYNHTMVHTVCREDCQQVCGVAYAVLHDLMSQ